MLINIGECLRALTCKHMTTTTHIQAFSEPAPHVTTRTVCMDCGKQVTPRSRVPDHHIEDMLRRAEAEAARKHATP